MLLMLSTTFCADSSVTNCFCALSNVSRLVTYGWALDDKLSYALSAGVRKERIRWRIRPQRIWKGVYRNSPVFDFNTKYRAFSLLNYYILWFLCIFWHRNLWLVAYLSLKSVIRYRKILAKKQTVLLHITYSTQTVTSNFR